MWNIDVYPLNSVLPIKFEDNWRIKSWDKSKNMSQSHLLLDL